VAISAIAPTNCWTEAEQQLAVALANCISVQSFLGVADATAALAGNMYIDAFPEPADGEVYSDAELESIFPGIMVGGPGEEEAFTLRYIASPNWFSPSGVLEVVFDRTEEAGATLQDQERIFKNQIGAIAEELTDRIHQDNSIYVESLTANVSRFSENEEQTIGPIQRGVIVVPWGTNNPGGEEGGE
jgi:hypothetical protein